MEKQEFHFYIASIREIFVSSGLLFLFSLIIFPILDFYFTLLLDVVQGDGAMWARVWYSPKTVAFWVASFVMILWLVGVATYLVMFWGWCRGIFKRSFVCLDAWGVLYDTYPTGKGYIPYSSIRAIDLDYKENHESGVVGYGKITIYYRHEGDQQMSQAVLDVNLLKYKWTWNGSGGGYLKALLKLDNSIRERTAAWKKAENVRRLRENRANGTM